MKSLRGRLLFAAAAAPVLCPTHGPQNRRAARAGVPAWCGASALSAWLRASFPAAFLKRHIQGRTLHHGRRLEDTGAAADRAGAGNACGRPVGAAPEPRKRAFQNPPARPCGMVERISSSMAAHCAASRCCIVVPLAGAAGAWYAIFHCLSRPFGLLASVPFCGLADAIGAVDMTLEYLPGLSYRRCVP